MIGDGILPAFFRQDPRYFRRGKGSAKRRIIYSIGASYLAKHDYTGRWEPNYSNIAGNMIAGGLLHRTYPDQSSGVGQAVKSGLVLCAVGTLGAVFNEFWPDISRKFFHRDPTHGLDTQAVAADKARTPSQEPAAR